MPPSSRCEHRAEVAERERRKAKDLAPYVAAALARKNRMWPLANDEIPVVKASVSAARVP